MNIMMNQTELNRLSFPIFSRMDKFRQESLKKLDNVTSRVLRNLCELFLILGITHDENFDRIESFVDVLRANNGQFVVKSEFSLIPDPTSVSNINRTLKRDLKSIEVYQRDFEPKYIKSLQKSCKGHVIRYLYPLKKENEPLNLLKYLKWVQRAVSWEDDVVKRYLHSSTSQISRDVLFQEMLLRRQKEIFSMSKPSVLDKFREMDTKFLNVLYLLHIKAEIYSSEFLAKEGSFIGKMFKEVSSFFRGKSKTKTTLSKIREVRCTKHSHLMDSVTYGYRSYICDKCRQSGTGVRWHCSKCSEDYCFTCEPKNSNDKSHAPTTTTATTTTTTNVDKRHQESRKRKDGVYAILRIYETWMQECEKNIISSQHERWEKQTAKWKELKQKRSRIAPIKICLDRQYFNDVSNLTVKSQQFIDEVCEESTSQFLNNDNSSIPVVIKKNFIRTRREIMVRVVNRKKFKNVDLNNDFTSLCAHVWSEVIANPRMKKDDELQKELKMLMNLFDLLNDKLDFLETYKILLASRILSPMFKDFETERKTLQYFKLNVSVSATLSMEVMLRDIENSHKMNEKWKDLAKRRKGMIQDASVMNVISLTQNSWPKNTLASRSNFAAKFPDHISEWLQEYSKTMLMKDRARGHLVVCKSLGSVVLSFKFNDKKSYRVRMSPSQASLILLLKKSGGEMSYSQIANTLEMHTEQAMNLLISVRFFSFDFFG
jgi:hypothetical protein